MGNQVHSIHLPDSFPFLKGTLAWALWCIFANWLFTDSVGWLSCPVAGQEALSLVGEGQGICHRTGREGKHCIELLMGRVLDKTVRFWVKILEGS